MKCKPLYFRILFFIFLLPSFYIATAQDIHFSQYYTHLSSLNPALVGNYDGSYRLSAIYRNQWGRFLGGDAYQTFGADVDFCLLEGYLRDSKLAIGTGLFVDRSGAAGLSKTNVSLTAAYHFGFGKDGNHRLSVGLQGAFLQENIDNPLFADQFNGHNQGVGTTAEQLMTFKPVWDVNAGIYYRAKIKNIARIGAGLGAFHVAEPQLNNVRQQAGNQSDRDFVLFRRFAADVHAEVFVDAKKKVSVTPELLMLFQGPAREITPGLLATYYFNSGFRQNNSVSAGFRYRVGDALVCMAQGEFRNIRLGFAYDVNLSRLSGVSRNQGSFEFSLTYIGETIKSVKANRALPSRRF